MEHMGSANIHPIKRKESFQIHDIFTKTFKQNTKLGIFTYS